MLIICPDCKGKGYSIYSYEWEYGTEYEPEMCEECDGFGTVNSYNLARGIYDSDL